MRMVQIDTDLINAWELWNIEILDPNAPEIIDIEWLNENPDGWYYIGIEDAGNGGACIVEVRE